MDTTANTRLVVGIQSAARRRKIEWSHILDEYYYNSSYSNTRKGRLGSAKFDSNLSHDTYRGETVDIS